MFYANDSLGNLGFKDINISKDTTVPKITINLFIIYYGDIYYIIGGIVSLVLTFKNRKPDQLPIKTGIIVGIIGASISSFLVSIYQWFIYILLFGFDIVVLGLYFVYFIPFALILGFIIGFAYGYIKKKQEEDGEQELSLIKMK